MTDDPRLTPADGDLRDRYAEALLDPLKCCIVAPSPLKPIHGTCKDCWSKAQAVADAVLAVRDTELERLQRDLEDARVQNEALRIAAAGAEGRVDLLIKAVARVRSMADEWQRRFPGEAWSASAAEAVHIATDIKGVTS